MNDRRTKEAIARSDAFVSLATGQGGSEDFSTYTVAIRTPFKGQTALEAQYKDDALAGRIVDRPADDATREGFSIVGTDENVDLAEMASDLEDLGFTEALNRTLKWSRLYGAALLIPLVDDGQDMSEPLDMDRIKSFSGFRVVDRYRATIDPGSFAEGAGLDFENPEWYMLSTSQRLPDGTNLDGRIHRSRVVRFDGVMLPTDLIKANGYYGMSVLEHGWRNLRRLATVRGYMEDGAHNLTGLVLKIAGLTKMLKGAAAADDGSSILEKIRMGIQRLRNNWNNMHWLALDKDDSIEQSNRNATGFLELEQAMINAVVMDYDIPRELLVHELKGALTSGESAGSIRLYYDQISAYQTNALTPAVNRVLEMYFASVGSGIDQWEVVWEPLWQPTPKEQAEIRKLDAETDQIYFEMAVFDPRELRQARLVEGQVGAIVMSPEMEAIAVEAEREREEEREREIAEPEPPVIQIPQAPEPSAEDE